MKIAVIGNMNNNGFALLRYLRDVGFDAHLFMFSNDGRGDSAHFHPKHDTWDYSLWDSYVHELPAPDNLIAGLGLYLALPLFLLLKIRSIFKKNTTVFQPVSRRAVKRLLGGYDYYIGSGISPALFKQCGLKLDVYYQYANGIEHLGTPEAKLRFHRAGPIERIFLKEVAAKQAAGIAEASNIYNTSFGLTKETLDSIGKGFEPLFVPMVYAEPNVDPERYSAGLKELLKQLESRERDCVFCSPSRQLWVNKRNFTGEQWYHATKNSDWLFRSFAELRREFPDKKLLLIVSEYGADIAESRELCEKLKISADVLWAPKLSRKELLPLIGATDVVVGEFMNTPEVLWGGVGWEALLSGKPLINGFKFEQDLYEQRFGHPIPPVLPANSAQQVFDQMRLMVTNTDLRLSYGEKGKEWFECFQGASLAKKWVR